MDEFHGVRLREEGGVFVASAVPPYSDHGHAEWMLSDEQRLGHILIGRTTTQELNFSVIPQHFFSSLIINLIPHNTSGWKYSFIEGIKIQNVSVRLAKNQTFYGR